MPVRYNSVEELLRTLSPDVEVEDVEALSSLLPSEQVRVTKSDMASMEKAYKRFRKQRTKQLRYALLIGMALGVFICFILFFVLGALLSAGIQ